jgi:NTE family protein
VTDSDPIRALVRHPLFDGVPAGGLEELRGLVRPRRLSAGGTLCRRGEEGDSLFVILSGLAHVLVEDEARPAAKLRRGDIVGEMSLLTGERRSATVIAATPMSLLELDRDAFAQLMARHPSILGNLTRVLSERLRETTARVGARPTRGEAVALIAGAGSTVLPELVEATRAASPRSIAVLDAQSAVEEALAQLDDALAANGLVLLLGGLAQESLNALIDAADRTVAIVANAGEAAGLAALQKRTAHGETIEVVVLHRPDETPPPLDESLQLVRSVSHDAEPLATGDARWLGRHIARAKLGLALGAGGAKGYAHIGALHVLEDAGHVVDGLAGSSVGAIVGAWLALGMSAAEVETTMRSTFSPDMVEAMFQRSFTGAATGLAALERAFRESTHDATFDDLCLPLVVMTVDLNSRHPAPVTEGPLWEALLAATALAGVFPPVERDGKRLVDGLALVPVPTDAVLELGADVSLSVNLIPRHTLEAWPGDDVPPEPPRLSGSRTLDSLLEVMDLAQLEASERQAARADVVVTPRFGPSTWRDFHLADLFLQAGWEAAEAERATLEKLVSPGLTPSRLST